MHKTNETEEALTRWQEESAAVQAQHNSIGVAKAEQIKGLTGLQVFQELLAGRLPSAPISQTLDFELVQVESGTVVLQGRPSVAHYNPMGTVHGGWYATLLDSAVACAVHSTLPAGKSYTTLELKINIVRVLTDRVPLVRAFGHIVHRGSQVATAEGRLVGPDGTLYAHASTTCMIFDARH